MADITDSEDTPPAKALDEQDQQDGVANALPQRSGPYTSMPRSTHPLSARRTGKVIRALLVGKLRRQPRRLYGRHAHREQSGTNTKSSVPGSQTHLVVSGQPTGWTAMAHAVRNFDEEKVKDCKEDVDTLLVFAGLFSAVLTAFLIESYKNLLEDPATQTMIAVRQLVAQTSSYQSQGDMFNSTAPPLLLQPFQASVLDIKVNVLWFASLLCSLITASFGILVKQWLREFLAAENPSPLARLRVRHLRYPQLSRWKVFEIAAVLPLLLQLSLALFFAGLCYFTASVHSSVKCTTLPLVLGWAFCFCAVTALPIVFPRCPYRTALLKGWVQSLHRNVGLAAKRVASSCGSRLPKNRAPKSPFWTRAKQVVYAGLELGSGYVSARLAEQDEVRAIRLPDNDIEILASVDSIQSNDELLGTAIAEAVDHIHCEPTQFEDFLRIILENRGHRSGQAVIIDLPHNVETYIRPFPLPILNLKLVSKQAWSAIHSVISHYVTNVRSEAGIIHIQSERSVRRRAYRTVLMCMIMLAISDCPLPEDGLEILRGRRFIVNGWHEICILLREALDTVDGSEGEGRNVSENKAGLLLRGLGILWGHLDAGAGELLRTAHQAIVEYEGLGSDVPRIIPLADYGLGGSDRRCIPALKWTEVDDWAIDHLPPKVKCDFLGLLLRGVAGILHNGELTHVDDDEDLSSTFRIILRLSYYTGMWQGDPSDGLVFDVILAAVLAAPKLTHIFVDTLLEAPFPWVYVFVVRFPDRLATLNPIYGIELQSFDWCTLLENFGIAVSSKLSDINNPVSSVNALKLCYFACSMVRFLAPVQPPREKWHALFHMLLDLIEHPDGEQLYGLKRAKARISDHMIKLVSKAEGPGPQWTPPKDGDADAYSEWANTWKDEESLFPDRLIESIAPYAPKSRINRSWRIRRALERTRGNVPIVGACAPSCTCIPNEWDDAPIIHTTEAYIDPTTWHGQESDIGAVDASGVAPQAPIRSQRLAQLLPQARIAQRGGGIAGRTTLQRTRQV